MFPSLAALRSVLANLSIRAKISIGTFLVCIVIAVTTSVAIAWGMVNRFQVELGARLESAVSVTAFYLEPALSFDDDIAAQRTLKSIQYQRDFIGGAVYNSANKLVAIYPADFITQVNNLGENLKDGEYHLTKSRLMVRTIMSGESPVGKLYLLASTEAMARKVQNLIKTTVIVLIFSLLLTALLGTMVQRSFTKPLSQLVQSTKDIAQSKNYKTQVSSDRTDEFG